MYVHLPSYLGSSDIVTRLGHTFVIERPEIDDYLPRDIIHSIFFDDSYHGELGFKFANSRGAVFLVDAVAETEKYILIETHNRHFVVRSDKGGKHMPTGIRYRGSSLEDALYWLNEIKAEPPHPQATSTLSTRYTDDTGTSYHLSSIKYIPTETRVRDTLIAGLHIHYASVRNVVS